MLIKQIQPDHKIVNNIVYILYSSSSPSEYRFIAVR
jgi:hypothetical protein